MWMCDHFRISDFVLITVTVIFHLPILYQSRLEGRNLFVIINNMRVSYKQLEGLSRMCDGLQRADFLFITVTLIFYIPRLYKPGFGKL